MIDGVASTKASFATGASALVSALATCGVNSPAELTSGPSGARAASPLSPALLAIGASQSVAHRFSAALLDSFYRSVPSSLHSPLVFLLLPSLTPAESVGIISTVSIPSSLSAAVADDLIHTVSITTHIASAGVAGTLAVRKREQDENPPPATRPHLPAKMTQRRA